MEFIKINVKNAKVISRYDGRNGFSDDFFYPMNKKHIYNMFCTMLDRNPFPQKRVVDQKYMPFYQDLMDLVENGYVKIKNTAENSVITEDKSVWNSNLTKEKQYTWRDAEQKLGQENFGELKTQMNSLFNINYQNAYIDGFEETLKSVLQNGTEEDILEFKKWFKKKSAMGFVRYMESLPYHKSSFLTGEKKAMYPQLLNKKNYKGVVNYRCYDVVLYIPINSEIKNEYEKFGKLYTKMLEDGVARFDGYHELTEDDVFGFVRISSLKDLKKSDILRADDYKESDRYLALYKKIKNSEKFSKEELVEMMTEIDIELSEEDAKKFIEKPNKDPKHLKALITKYRNKGAWNLNKILNLCERLDIEYNESDWKLDKNLSDFQVIGKATQIINQKFN